MSGEAENTKDDTKPNYRNLGLILIGLGCLVLLCFVGWPIYRAHSAASEITLFYKFIGLGVFLLVLGITSTIFNVDAFDWFPKGETNLSDVKLKQWLWMAGNLGAAIAATIVFSSYLRSLGYHTAF